MTPTCGTRSSRASTGKEVEGVRAGWAVPGKEMGRGERKGGKEEEDLRPDSIFFSFFCFSFSRDFREEKNKEKIRNKAIFYLPKYLFANCEFLDKTNVVLVFILVNN